MVGCLASVHALAVFYGVLGQDHRAKFSRWSNNTNPIPSFGAKLIVSSSWHIFSYRAESNVNVLIACLEFAYLRLEDHTRMFLFAVVGFV
nr:unnamed protein product [Callosobruchus analis]